MQKLAPKLRFQFAFKRFIEHIFDISSRDRLLDQKISDQLAGKGIGKKMNIDIFENVDFNFLHSNYIKPGIPFILKGIAKDWKCVKTWSPDYFIEKYGNDSLSVMDNDIAKGTFNVEDLTIRDFMLAVKEGDKKKYLRFGNLLHKYPELVYDFDYEFIQKLKGCGGFGNNFGAFVGAQGTKTPLHSAPPDNIFVQVYGVKNWIIYHSSSDPMLRPTVDRSTYFSTQFDPSMPDYKEFPATQYLDYYQFDLEPGDILYNPPCYWHQVYNKSASFGVGFRWMTPKVFRLNFSQSILFFLATNPNLLTVMKNKKHYANVLKLAEEKTKKVLDKAKRG